MAAISSEITNKIKHFIMLAVKEGINIERAILFGSHVKGTATAWSDIDLALVSRDFTGSAFYDRKRLNPFLIQVDSRLELHPFKSEDFYQGDPFIKEILEHGIEII